MTDESVATLLEDLADERSRTWDPTALRAAAERRAYAVEWASVNPAAAVGTVLEPFSVAEVDAGILTLSDIATAGPAVLLFFRFAGCGVCNLTLPHYGRVLAPQLAGMGVPLVAISPQPPDELAEIKRTHSLRFQVAYDAGNGLARQLGITFVPKEPVGPPDGTMLQELPHPSFVIVDPSGMVRWIKVCPDWMVWVEAEKVVEAVRTTLAS